MKNKTKRVFWGFFSLDYKAIEAYLEEMAEKGWMLEKVGRMTAKFRAIEPKKLKFYVDVFKGGGPLAPENTKEAEEYRSLCQESGWNFITSRDYLQFFYAEEDEDPVPIQTDEALEQKNVETTLWRGEVRTFLCPIKEIFMSENKEQEVINRRNCVMIYAMDIIGGKWRLPIIWKLYQNKTMRYNELKRNLVGITNIMLTRSLQSLEESGLVSRVEFNQIPPRVEYSLTDNCLQLVPALESIYNWGHERMIRENLDL